MSLRVCVQAWEEGSDFIALRNAEAELRERRADLEKLQKDVARRHKKLRDSTGGAGGAGGEGKPNARGARGRGGGKSPAGSAFNAGAAADADMLSDEEDGGLDEVDAVTSPLDTGRSLRSVADEYGLGAFMGSTLSLVSSGGGGASASASAATLDLRAQHMAELDLMEVEEALKVNLMSLKREEQLLADRRKALEAEKQLLLLELKKRIKPGIVNCIRY
ncbi:MAG: hypothetical protein EOO61_04750 [Hymenobacter sp.]|nr:MAG: hypothetical protein EOO61_04750 [Hymenobacter sp.]